MNRALWFVAGAGAGVYAMTSARRAAEVFTPEGLADRLAGLAVGARLFADEVRAGMAEKENEVRRTSRPRVAWDTTRRAVSRSGATAAHTG